MTQTYEGWTNRETWNVSLWMGNHEPLYRLVLNMLKNTKNEGDFADTLEAFLLIIWQRINDECRTPDGLSLKPVNFAEIAEHWWEDYEDLHPLT